MTDDKIVLSLISVVVMSASPKIVDSKPSSKEVAEMRLTGDVLKSVIGDVEKPSKTSVELKALTSFIRELVSRIIVGIAGSVLTV